MKMHSLFANQSKNMLFCGVGYRSVLLLILGIGILLSAMPFEAQAVGGSYKFQWYAADPAVNRAPYLPTYIKYTPAYLSCPGTDGRYSGSAVLPNAVLYGPTYSTSNIDAVDSLAPKTLALGQIVPFEVEISVNGDTTPENGVIQFTSSFNTNTTSGSNFGFDPKYMVYCAFVDTSDPGTIDPGNNAKVDSYTSTMTGSGTNQAIQGTFQVSGLDSGDNIVVEIWVFLKSTIPSKSTGNVQSSMLSAKTVKNDTINLGTMTVPLLKISDVNEFFTEINDLAVTKTDIPDPVVQGQQLRYNITLKNIGDSNVSNMVIATDTLSPALSFVSASVSSYTIDGRNITFNAGALSPGETKNITIVTSVSSTAPTNNDTSMSAETGGYFIPTFFDIYNRVLICAMCKDANPNNNIYYQPTNVLKSPGYNYTYYNQTAICNNPFRLTVNSTSTSGLSLQIVWKDQNGTFHHSETVEKLNGKYTSALFTVPSNSGGTWTVEVTEYSGSLGSGIIIGRGTSSFTVTCGVPEFPVGSSIFLLVTGVGYLGMRKKMAGFSNGKR